MTLMEPVSDSIARNPAYVPSAEKTAVSETPDMNREKSRDREIAKKGAPHNAQF